MPKRKRTVQSNTKINRWTPSSPNLRAWQKSLGISVKEAAEWLGISERRYSYYINHSNEPIDIPWSIVVTAEYIYQHQREFLRLFNSRALKNKKQR